VSWRPGAGNDEGADLRTSGGRLTVYLPAGVGFDLDADASGGRVDSDVSVDVEGSIRDGRMRGTINGGGNTLRLRNNDGNIRIMATGGGRG